MKLPALIFLIASLSLSAQSNWQFAEVMMQDGTTRVGEVDDRHWGFRFRNIRFRPQGERRAQRLAIDEIRRFDVAGRRYEIVDEAVNTSPRRTVDLVEQQYRTEDGSRKPMQLLVEGPLSLYEYYDERSNSHFFIRTPNGEVVYLEFGRYLVDKDFAKFYYSEVNNYYTTLRQQMQDCAWIGEDINRTRYTRASLMRLFQRYYECSTRPLAYEMPPDRGQWTFGANVSFVGSNLRYGKLPAGALFFGDLTSYDPVFGAHARYRFGGFASDVSISLGAKYHDFSVQRSRLAEEDPVPGITQTEEYAYREQTVMFEVTPEVILVRSRYPVILSTTAAYHHILNYQESRFIQRVSGTDLSTTGLFYNFRGRGAFSLGLSAGVLIGHTRIQFWGSATRRSYDDFSLNLYRYGITGSYDF